MSFFSFCLLSLLLIPEVFGCYCHYSQTRMNAICGDFQTRNDVYSATVEAAYCKCLPGNATEKFSCIRYWQTEGGDVEGMTQSTYSCNVDRINDYFIECSEVTTSATGSISQTVDPITFPITNLSNETDCGFDGYTKREGCDLTRQPCFYTLKVIEVYKGNYTNGEKLNTFGPDVLTSCGQYGRVLEVGEHYLVGIGGACEPISEWSTVDSYSANEFELLGQLMNGTSDNVCGSAIITTSFTTLLFLLLIALYM